MTKTDTDPCPGPGPGWPGPGWPGPGWAGWGGYFNEEKQTNAPISEIYSGFQMMSALGDGEFSGEVGEALPPGLWNHPKAKVQGTKGLPKVPRAQDIE